MKKNVIRISFILLVALTFSFCTDNYSDNTASGIMNSENLSLKTTNQDAAFLGLKLHRAIHTRPRDGMICYCNDCFGICQADDFGCGWDRGILVPNSGGTTGILYIIDDVANAENEFGVDEDITLPSEVLENTNFASIKILNDLYSYTIDQDTITIGGTAYTYYGYVQLNLVVTKN